MPPAARITDMHVCPMVTVLVPHVGGPILPPAAITVLTGSLPQARLGDMAVCVGPPDVIALGCFTVLVCGQPAARMGDLTAHGGTIVLGLPTVLIGDGGGGGGAGSAGQMDASDAAKAVFETLQANSGNDDKVTHQAEGSDGKTGAPMQPADLSHADEAQTVQTIKTAAQTGAALMQICFGKSPLLGQPPDSADGGKPGGET